MLKVIFLLAIGSLCYSQYIFDDQFQNSFSFLTFENVSYSIKDSSSCCNSLLGVGVEFFGRSGAYVTIGRPTISPFIIPPTHIQFFIRANNSDANFNSHFFLAVLDDSGEYQKEALISQYISDFTISSTWKLCRIPFTVLKVLGDSLLAIVMYDQRAPGTDFSDQFSLSSEAVTSDVTTTAFGSTTSQQVFQSVTTESPSGISAITTESDLLQTSDESNNKILFQVVGIAVGIGLTVIIIVVIIAIIAVMNLRTKRRQSPGTQLELSNISKTTPKAQWQMLKDVKILEELGSGNFGTVCRGEWNGVSVALKKLKSKEDTHDFMNECNVLQGLRHPCIIQYLGIYSPTPSEIYIVMEFLQQGSLLGLLRKKGTAMQPEFPKMAREVASGMAYLHQNRIIHRDLALRNLLVSERDGKFQIKISDFGLTRSLGDAEYYRSEDKRIPVKWVSVEVLKYGTYSFASDIWSYGITIWEMFNYGAVPYPGMSNSEVIDALLTKHYRLSAPNECPQVVYELMKMCWKENPSDRPTFEDVCKYLDNLVLIGSVPKNVASDSGTNANISASGQTNANPESNFYYNQ